LQSPRLPGAGAFPAGFLKIPRGQAAVSAPPQCRFCFPIAPRFANGVPFMRRTTAAAIYLRNASAARICRPAAARPKPETENYRGVSAISARRNELNIIGKPRRPH